MIIATALDPRYKFTRFGKEDKERYLLILIEEAQTEAKKSTIPSGPDYPIIAEQQIDDPFGFEFESDNLDINMDEYNLGFLDGPNPIAPRSSTVIQQDDLMVIF